MMPVPPPQGISETDYETIEAAVTETVRGRWFLAEFARRNRSAEMRQLLDAIARLESTVATSQAALPAVDPSIRMLIQRIQEVTAHLNDLSHDMREAGIGNNFIQAVELQARAVAGLVRGGAAPAPAIPPRIERPGRTDAALPDAPPSAQVAPPRVSAERTKPDLPASHVPDPARQPSSDPRLTILSPLDDLSFPQKLAVFR